MGYFDDHIINYNKYNDDLFNKLELYIETFDKIKLLEYEKVFFNNSYNKVARSEIEFRRLKRDLKAKSYDLYIKYLSDINRITELFKVSSFDKTVIEEIQKIIVKIQLENDFPIRLYSIIYDLYEDVRFERITEEINIKR